ncbi:hypothetical protein P7H19_14475 [Paenibacillus larvae]|nr:hypothetical protein [Paenibacillus larvae]MDT2237250.1 hypothetical protein [Paenibacillus larvae]
MAKMETIHQELEILSLAKEVKLRYDKRKGVLGYRQIRTIIEPETQKESK